MAGQEAKITEKPSTNVFSSTDSLVCITNNAVKLVNTATFFSNITIRTTLSTPANSTINVIQGTIFFDSTYLYLAVANNTLKRVALNSF